MPQAKESIKTNPKRYQIKPTLNVPIYNDHHPKPSGIMSSTFHSSN